MLALAEREALSCRGCGGWLPETTDKQNDDRYVSHPTRCHSCTAQSIAQDAHAKGKHEHLGAVLWSTPTLKPRG